MSDVPTPPSADEIEVGDSGPTVTETDLEVEEFVRYAGASGDFTPLHYEEEFAQAAGHDTVIAQGMLLAGYASRFVTDWFGTQYVASFSTRFSAPVEAGADVTVSGEVTDVDDEGDAALVSVEFRVEDGDGTEALTGTATARLPGE